MKHTVLTGNASGVARQLDALAKVDPKYDVLGLDKTGSAVTVLVKHVGDFKPIDFRAEAIENRLKKKAELEAKQKEEKIALLQAQLKSAQEAVKANGSVEKKA